ncbi:MAG: hypothetical protein R2865_00585 [Deinococcales bacterium]
MPKSMPKYLAGYLGVYPVDLVVIRWALLFGLPLAKRDRSDVQVGEGGEPEAISPKPPSFSLRRPFLKHPCQTDRCYLKFTFKS